MGSCGGTRIDHLDGSLAACSQELLGRVCGGSVHRSQATCEELLGAGGCEHCEAVFQAEAVVSELLARLSAGPVSGLAAP